MPCIPLDGPRVVNVSTLAHRRANAAPSQGDAPRRPTKAKHTPKPVRGESVEKAARRLASYARDI